MDSKQLVFAVSHNGGIPGFVTNLSFYPAEDICVVVISNNGGNSDRMGAALASILFDLPVQIPYTPKEVKIDSIILDKYLGKYNANGPIELIKKNNKLYRHRDGAPDIELKPESTTRFFYADESDRFIEFELDKAGKMTKAWFIGNGDKIEMKVL